MACAKIQVGSNCHISVVREFVSHFTIPFIPAGHVMRQYNGSEWTCSERARKIGIDPFAVRAGKCDCFCQYAFIHISSIHESSPLDKICLRGQAYYTVWFIYSKALLSSCLSYACSARIFWLY